MLNTVFQRQMLTSLASLGEISINTGVVLPIRRGISDKVGVFNTGTFAESAIVVLRILPWDEVPSLTVYSTLRPFSLDGDWNTASFASDYAAREEDISAALLASSGVVEFNNANVGPFDQTFRIVNSSVSTVDIVVQVLVLSDSADVMFTRSPLTSQDGTYDSLEHLAISRVRELADSVRLHQPGVGLLAGGHSCSCSEHSCEPPRETPANESSSEAPEKIDFRDIPITFRLVE